MTRIEDMSETERKAWVTLIVDVAVFIFFIRRMTIDWSIHTYSPRELLSIFIAVIVITIVMHAIIAGIFESRKRKDDIGEKDERDIKIERMGASYGFYFLAIFVNILVGYIILQNSIEGLDAAAGAYEGPFDFRNTSHLVFALIGAAIIGDIIKNGRMILAYRGA